MSNCATTRLLPVEQAYQLWAAKYDAAPNPLLCLEERHLAPLLQPTTECDVVDLGCGTGRWLEWIAATQPRSLTGVDISAAMLECATDRLGSIARLVQADCISTPLVAASADLILASFVLSYVEDLNQLAREMARIARPRARVLFSDVHPTTREFGWKRTFRCAQHVIEIQTHPYEVHELHTAMINADFELNECSEYCFGTVERADFLNAGRLDLYEAVKEHPVLLLASYSGGY